MCEKTNNIDVCMLTCFWNWIYLQMMWHAYLH